MDANEESEGVLEFIRGELTRGETIGHVRRVLVERGMNLASANESINSVLAEPKVVSKLSSRAKSLKRTGWIILIAAVIWLILNWYFVILREGAFSAVSILWGSFLLIRAKHTKSLIAGDLRSQDKLEKIRTD